MKKYDKNSLIGFVLMAVILIVFNTFFFPEIPQEQAPVAAPTESIITENKNSALSKLSKNKIKIDINTSRKEVLRYTPAI